MALLGKLFHAALSTDDGVVAVAAALLEGELKPHFTGPLELQVVRLGEPLRVSFSTLFGKERGRVDRVLFGEVLTAAGRVQISVPFSGRSTLAAHFSCTVPLGTPAAAQLSRTLFGFGRWESLPGSSLTPEGTLFVQKLADSRLSADVVWNCRLPGNYYQPLEWTVQVVPEEAQKCRLIMQSGRLGLVATNFGFAIFLQKIAQLRALLSEPQVASWPVARPAALSSLADTLVAAAVAPPRPPIDSRQASIDTRSKVALTLALIGIPMCLFALPLGLASFALALHTRMKAKREGLVLPRRNTWAMAIGGTLAGLFAVVLALPKTLREPVVADATEAQLPSAQVPLGKQGDAPEPGMRFSISGLQQQQAPTWQPPFHEAGGTWQTFEATTDDGCAFSVAVAPYTMQSGFGFGKLRLAFASLAAHACFVDELARNLGVAAPSEIDGAPGAIEVTTAVLGENLRCTQSAGCSGRGSWTATKLFFESGEASGEIFFDYDLKHGKGFFSEKDAEYDHDVVEVLATGLSTAPKSVAQQ